MPTLNLDKYHQPVVDNNTPTPSTNVDTSNFNPQADNKLTVTLTGPLSTIYAEALIKVLGPSTRTVSTETNQIETVVLSMAEDEELSSIREDAVVYITDADHIEKNPIGEFDNIRIALDSKGKRHVVVESMGNVSSNMGTIVEYASHRGATLHFSRSNFLRYMSK